MKIFYAVQATGNGHISRAMEILPFLKLYGEVDVFLSGANSSLDFDFPVKYRSKGLSLHYTCNGTINFPRTITSFAPYRLWKEIGELPVEKYDVVLNDFECITALACARKRIPSVHFGHQASFMSPQTPRPAKSNLMGEWILKNYACSTFQVGLHFKQYDHFILPPVIKRQILTADPSDKGFICVYLPSYCENVLSHFFHKLPDHVFYIFSRQTKKIRKDHSNIIYMPVDRELFNDFLVNCHGIITGAGFETPAEAMCLGKKLMVIPIEGQYEQQCNAAALERMGIKKIDRLDKDFKIHFHDWLGTASSVMNYRVSTGEIISEVMKLSIGHIQQREAHSSADLLTPSMQPQ